MAAESQTPDDDAEIAETLAVSPETVIRGLQLTDKPGVSRKIVFSTRVGSGGALGEGVLQDTSNLSYNGEPPIQLSPSAFVPDYLRSPSPAERTAREEARSLDGEDEEEWEEMAREEWERQVRRSLKDQIKIRPVYPEEESTVYAINYSDDDE